MPTACNVCCRGSLFCSPLGCVCVCVCVALYETHHQHQQYHQPNHHHYHHQYDDHDHDHQHQHQHQHCCDSKSIENNANSQNNDIDTCAFRCCNRWNSCRQGPCLVCVDPPIEDDQGQPTLPLTAADIHVLRSDMPFKALPENGLVSHACCKLIVGCGKPPGHGQVYLCGKARGELRAR